MALPSGTKLGPYEITGALGAGGMGEVYRARDTKLNRDVALKVLPEAFAADPQRMARFEREAQVLASLNHPNIAMIHGLEESGSTRALVMELVEGQTLAERIGASARPASGSTVPGIGAIHELPLQESLAIAKQVAEALEYAHERGVVHRDLKPANIKITPEGTVKVLDFGLAKAMGPDEISRDVSNSPTMSAAMTQAGFIIGTAAYMSPEQAKARPVDRRCDIWAFGVVLFEMLSGKKAFEGETVSDVLAAVIMKDPDFSALPETTPPSIQRLIRRCLNKDPKQRLRDIGEARITIEETLSGSPLITGPLPVGEGGPQERDRVRVPPPHRVLPWVIAGVAVVALIAVIALWKFSAPSPQASPVLSYIPPPPNTTFRDFGFSPGPVAVSPDGKRLAFSATNENGVTKLYVRSLASKEAKAIAGTEDAAMPFWSPDGSSLGFLADGKLKTVNLGNGNVQILADATEDTCADRGAWSASGTILFTPGGCEGPLDKISASGGKPTPATKLESGEVGHMSPALLPDGRHFLYFSLGRGNSGSIWMASLGSSEQEPVLKNADSPEFADGHLLFSRGNRIFAQPFDPATGKLSGEATALAEAQQFSVSRGQVLAFQGGMMEGRLEWFDRSGNPLSTVGPTAIYGSVRISPDGKHVIGEVDDSQFSSSDLWSYPAAGGPGTRLTFGPGFKEFEAWSPDGKYIAFTCRQNGKWGICRKPANGSGTEQKLFTLGGSMNFWFAVPVVVDWSPDGRYISLNEYVTKASRTELSVLPLAGNRKLFQPAPISASQFEGEFSPDGHWLAYFSYETGRPEIYVVPFPGPGGKFQISQNGGWLCRWDRKGHLYFLSMGDRLMEATLGFSGGAVQVKSLQPLFHVDLPSFADPLFDVSPDGNRFLVITSTGPNASRSIGLLLNWQSKLKGKQ
jgi:eukaryotic-like serine/threonine-protein kinase